LGGACPHRRRLRLVGGLTRRNSKIFSNDPFARRAPPASATSRHTQTPLPEPKARLRPRQRRRRRAGAESNVAWPPCLAALRYTASVSSRGPPSRRNTRTAAPYERVRSVIPPVEWPAFVPDHHACRDSRTRGNSGQRQKAPAVLSHWLAGAGGFEPPHQESCPMGLSLLCGAESGSRSCAGPRSRRVRDLPLSARHDSSKPAGHKFLMRTPHM
jgi:hypothetical protein